MIDKKTLYCMFADNMERVNWAMALRTGIVSLKDWQSELKTERDRCAAEFAKHQLEHAANSKKGGAASAESRRGKMATRNKDIVEYAEKLLAAGRKSHEIVGILAQQKNLSARQIRTILKKRK
jgi:hypothetical protein